MTESPQNSPRSLWRAWLCWLLLPLPAVLFWRSHDGRFIALCCFFVSCTSLVVFSALCLFFNDPHDLIAPALALLTLIPSMCIAPYLTLSTRKPFAAVVLTVFLVACMKMVAGSVTVLVHGWHATEYGYTTLLLSH